MDEAQRRVVGWLAQVLSAGERRDTIMSTLLDAALEVTSAERGYVVAVDGTTSTGRPRLRVEVARGYDRQTLQGAEGKLSRTVVLRVLERGRGLSTSSEEDRDVTEITSVRKARVLSILCAPIRSGEATLGVVYLDHRFLPEAFTLADLEVLEALACETSIALARVRPEE